MCYTTVTNIFPTERVLLRHYDKWCTFTDQKEKSSINRQSDSQQCFCLVCFTVQHHNMSYSADDILEGREGRMKHVLTVKYRCLILNEVWSVDVIHSPFHEWDCKSSAIIPAGKIRGGMEKRRISKHNETCVRRDTDLILLCLSYTPHRSVAAPGTGIVVSILSD